MVKISSVVPMSSMCQRGLFSDCSGLRRKYFLPCCNLSGGHCPTTRAFTGVVAEVFRYWVHSFEEFLLWWPCDLHHTTRLPPERSDKILLFWLEEMMLLKGCTSYNLRIRCHSYWSEPILFFTQRFICLLIECVRHSLHWVCCVKCAEQWKLPQFVILEVRNKQGCSGARAPPVAVDLSYLKFLLDEIRTTCLSQHYSIHVMPV